MKWFVFFGLELDTHPHPTPSFCSRTTRLIF